MSLAGQCPTCGRCPEDFSSAGSRTDGEGGGKGKQRKQDTDTAAAYRRWRWGWGAPYYATDVDQVEWRQGKGGELHAVAVFELTRVEGNMPVPPTYLDAVLARFTKRDGQAGTAKRVAKQLGVKAWIVLFRWDLTGFWVYNLTDDRGWFGLSKVAYQEWVKSLREEPSGYLATEKARMESGSGFLLLECPKCDFVFAPDVKGDE